MLHDERNIEAHCHCSSMLIIPQEQLHVVDSNSKHTCSL